MLDLPYNSRKPVEYTDENTGYKTMLYPIGALAMSLGRTPTTIRKWELLGVIPKTPFRVDGRRYYSEEQVKICEEVAEKVHLSAGKTHISHTTFKRKVNEKWRELFIKIFGRDIYESEEENEEA